MSGSVRPTSLREFDGQTPRAMAGGSAAHSAIQSNIVIAVGIRLRGTPCRVHGSELKIEVAGSIRYPDALVICAPIDPQSTVSNEPTVVFEVLSPSTMRVDRIDKLREYQLTPSIKRYMMLEHDIAVATAFTRNDSEWIGRVRYAGETLDMPEIGISVPMSEFYLDVDIPTVPESKSPPSGESGDAMN